MNKKLTENEIMMIKKLVQEMKQEASGKLSLEENMQISFAARVDNLDEEKEVAAICKGIHTFDDLLKQMDLGEEKQLIIETIENSKLKNKGIQEQYAILAEELEAFKADLTNKGYDLGELKDLEIKKDKEVTEKELNELKEMLAEYLDQFALLHGEPEIMESFFQSIEGEVSEALLQLYENENEKYYMALAVYILQLQGKLDTVTPETGAEGIGVDVAASVASAKVHIKRILGKISSEEVINALRKIAKAALTIMIGLAIGAAAYIVGKFTFIMATEIFGCGIIGTIIAMVYTANSMVLTIDGLYKIWEDVKETVENAKECALTEMILAKHWITEEALPALRLFWERVKEKISCCVPNFAKTEQKVEEVSEGYEVVEDVVAEV